MRRKWRTDGTYERLLKLQHNRCGICRKERKLDVHTQKWERFDIDHDHVTDVPRGLLCRSCNWKLSNHRDAEWMRRAYFYLAGAERKTA